MSNERDEAQNREIEELKRKVSELSSSVNIVSDWAINNASGQGVNPLINGFDEISKVLKTYLAPLRNLAPVNNQLPHGRARRLKELYAAMGVPDWSNVTSLTVQELPVIFIGDLLPKIQDVDPIDELVVVFPTN